jgi:hypothetical protein
VRIVQRPRRLDAAGTWLWSRCRKDTALLLADALNLAEPVRGLFVAEVLAAVRGLAPGAAAGRAATRTLPREMVNFTGRARESSRSCSRDRQPGR